MRVVVWDTPWGLLPAPTSVSTFNTALTITDNLLLSPTTDPAGQAAPDPYAARRHPLWINNTSPAPDSAGAQG